VNVTDGGSVAAGRADQHLHRQRGGRPRLPAQWTLRRAVQPGGADDGGDGRRIEVSITPNTGNPKINAFELIGEAAPAPVTYTLAAAANNASWGSVSPAAGTYASGTVVQVTASPSNGFSFVNWTGDASGSANPLSLTMDADRSITANFATNEPLPAITNTLIVESAYGTPAPSGTTLHTNGAVIACSVAGSPIVNGSTTLTCTGWTLLGNNPLSGGGTGFSLTLTNDATLTWLWTTNIVLPVTNGYVVTWSSLPGATYAIDVGTNLFGAFTAVATNIAATPAMNTHTAAAPAGSPAQFFYRVRKE
jgi:hypothetical protein